MPGRCGDVTRLARSCLKVVALVLPKWKQLAAKPHFAPVLFAGLLVVSARAYDGVPDCGDWQAVWQVNCDRVWCEREKGQAGGGRRAG